MQCGKRIHSRCAGVKMVTPKFSRDFTCIKCEGNIGEAVELEVMLCDEVETVCEFTYLGVSVSAGGGCEATVTARTISRWVKFREYSGLLYGRRFPLRVKGAVNKSYVKPAILYGSEAWCLKESKMGILRRTERSMARAMCGVQLRDRKRSMDLMFMQGLKETIDHLTMASSVRWYGHVLRREGGHISRRAFDFEIEGQMKKGRPKRT